jgi:hypothetical protein
MWLHADQPLELAIRLPTATPPGAVATAVRAL